MVNMIIILYKITRELIKYFLTCLLALHDNETFSQTTGIAFSRNLSLGKPGGGGSAGRQSQLGDNESEYGNQSGRGLGSANCEGDRET